MGACAPGLRATAAPWRLQPRPAGRLSVTNRHRAGREPDGQPLGSLDDHPRRVNDLAFSPDSQLLVTASSDQTARVWRIADASAIQILDHGGGVDSVAYSPDGQYIATGATDGLIRIWRTADGQVERTIPGESVTTASVAFSPDGQALATGGFDRIVRLWRVSDGAPVRELKGQPGAVLDIALSQDGTLLASGSDDYAARLWSVEDGKPLHPPQRRAQGRRPECRVQPGWPVHRDRLLGQDRQDLARGERRASEGVLRTRRRR